MVQIKLYILLETLAPRERTRFKEYIFSPYFNKNKYLHKLGEILINEISRPRKKKLTKSKVYNELFENETFDELKFNNITSDLLQLLYDFLGDEEYKKDELTKMNYLGKAMLKRELYHHLKPIERKYKLKRSKSSHLNADHYLTEYFFYETLDLFSLSGGGSRKHNDYLQLKSDNLDLYYLADKLRIACDMESRSLVINADYKSHFIEELLERYEAEKIKYKKFPALALYYEILKMLKSEHDDRYYHGVKKRLEHMNSFFPKKELQTIYDYLLNYSIRRINSGQLEFYREILSLYQFLLSKNILLVNKYITQWNYNNIITAAIRLNEYDWAENFIHTYKLYLLPSERFNVFTYNLTALYFAKKEYGKALKLLNEVEFTDAFYHASAKITQLKVYFELDETEAFYALIEAFKKFIHRNKQLSDYQKKSNLNFIKATSWIYKQKLLTDLGKKTEVNKWQEELWIKIEKLKPLGNKVWLKGVLKH